MVYGENFCRRTLTHLLKDFDLRPGTTKDDVIAVMTGRDWVDLDHMINFLKMYDYIH